MPEQLTASQLQDIIDFSQGILASQQYFSPFMQNQLLNRLNNNPRLPSFENIKKSLANYVGEASQLQGYVEFMQKWDMLFARVLRSYSDILSFDLQIAPQGQYSAAEINSKEFQEDKNRIYKFLDAFDYKSEFHKMCVEVMRHEIVYTWFRKTKWGNKGMKGTLQMMPQKYCILTGYWEKGLLYDFDMSYFLQPGVDIDGFDPVFKRWYIDMFGDNGFYKDYVPTNPMNARDGVYGLWHQTSAENGAWAFKFDMNDFNAAPFLAPYLLSALSNNEIADLQRDKDMMEAYGILAGEIRLLDNTKSGEIRDQFAIAPKTLGKFMGAVKAGLDNRIKAVAMPTENIKFFQFNDSTPDMSIKNLSSSAGVGTGLSRVIYSSDRMSNAEIQYAAETQYHIMQPMYYQFENFLNYFANKLTKKYKFSFIFNGSSYQFDKDKRFERIMKLADKGLILDPSAYAFALDMRPQDFERSLSVAMANRWYGKLGLFPNTNTTAGSTDNQAGRPTIDDDLLSDSGERNRDE